jgi:hypothetical protein
MFTSFLPPLAASKPRRPFLHLPGGQANRHSRVPACVEAMIGPLGSLGKDNRARRAPLDAPKPRRRVGTGPAEWWRNSIGTRESYAGSGRYCKSWYSRVVRAAFLGMSNSRTFNRISRSVSCAWDRRSDTHSTLPTPSPFDHRGWDPCVRIGHSPLYYPLQSERSSCHARSC